MNYLLTLTFSEVSSIIKGENCSSINLRTGSIIDFGALSHVEISLGQKWWRQHRFFASERCV